MSNSYILGALRALLCRELIFGCPTRVVTFAFHERVISLNQPGMLIAIKKAEAPRQEPHSTLGLNRVCRGVLVKMRLSCSLGGLCLLALAAASAEGPPPDVESLQLAEGINAVPSTCVLNIS